MWFYCWIQLQLWPSTPTFKAALGPLPLFLVILRWPCHLHTSLSVEGSRSNSPIILCISTVSSSQGIGEDDLHSSHSGAQSWCTPTSLITLKSNFRCGFFLIHARLSATGLLSTPCHWIINIVLLFVCFFLPTAVAVLVTYCLNTTARDFLKLIWWTRVLLKYSVEWTMME